MGILSFFFGSIAVAPDRADWVRAEQFAAYIKTAPYAALATAINSALLTYAYWGESARSVLIVWSYSALLMACYLMINSIRRTASAVISERVLNRIALHSGCVGIIWGVLFAVLLTSGDEQGRVLTGVVAAGMMCGGAFFLSVLPKASFAYIAPMALGVVVGALGAGQSAFAAGAIMIVVYALLLQRGVTWLADSFVSGRIKAVALAESSDVISLLLHDFETHSSDWLWEIDADGHLNRVSKRFAEAVMRPRETLEGEHFLHFFDDAYAEQLQEMFDHQRPFRELIVPVEIAGERRWWSISARPQINETGELTGYRGVCSDVTDAKAAEAKIAYMAHYDALTKLPNRTTMTTALERAVERSKTAGEQFAVLCVDLDKFKSINDTLGHPAGDTLLRGVANRLIDCVGAHDVVARFGGDEFVVLKTRVEDIDEVEFLGDTIVDALLEPFDLNGQQAMISGSVGIAFAPKDGDSAEVLLKHADLALYRAKSNGRGRTQFFESSMDEEARKRMAVEHDLRRALYEGDELRLHFQPLVHAATTDVIGYEALLRWNRPNGDVVMPSDFIDVAEETGLIVPLGEWVIRQAIQEAAHWTHEANVAVNLSPIQMKNPALISTVVQALAATGLPPNRLELEITESVLMQETDANLKTLHALKDLGVQIALDDFGTGYSSLNYLRAFPFDKIKIDKCFVEEMEDRNDCRAIIRAVMSLAVSLGMRVTAEGVENERQVELLTAEGCVEMQGYLYSRPIPCDQIAKSGAVASLIAAPADTLKRSIKRLA